MLPASRRADEAAFQDRRVARRSRLERWYPVLVFIVAVVALMPRSLAGQATYIAVDMGEPHSPYRDAIERAPRVVSPVQTDQIEHLPLTLKFADELRRGNWQLWEPAVGAGSPTATTFPWLVSPFNVVYLVLPGWYATTVDAALTLLVGQALMFLFLRRLGTGRPAATIGAVAYAFTGTNLVFMQRPFGAVWVLPGLLWAIHRAMERTTAPRIIAVAGFVAWCWFEGFPAAFFYSAYSAMAWAAWLAVRAFARRTRAVPLWTSVRPIAGRLIGVAGGFVWGGLLAMVTLLPFVDEVQRRGLLERRSTDLHSHLPSFYLWSIFDLSVNGDPLDPGSVWGGVNPFESVTIVGSIVLAAATIGFLPPVRRRLRLTAEGRDAWPFFALLPPAIAFLVFVGTRVLGWMYHVPGIASNPLSRARFLIGLGMAVLAALHLDHLFDRRERATESLPRWASLLPMAAWGGIALVVGDDIVRAARAAGQGDELKRGLVIGALYAAIAALVVAAGRRLRLPHALVACAVVGLVYVQVAVPLRDFTPEAPVSDFYPDTSGYETLRRLGAGEHRFAASAFSYYPNSAQLLDLYDLRGIVLYDEPLRAMLTAATPATFARDPLKQVLVREEWNLASPIYDDLALRHFVLSTGEVPFGQIVPLDSEWTRWDDLTSAEAALDVPTGPALAGVAFPIRAGASCAGSDVEVSIVQGARVLDTSERPAYDAVGSWLHLGLVGRSLQPGVPATVTVTVDPPCEVQLGVVEEGGDLVRPAVQTIHDLPDDGVELVATEEGWIYERPNARTLVSAHTDWRWFADQASLLDELAQRTPAEVSTALVVGSGSAPPADPGARAVVDRFVIEDDAVRATVDASTTALLVVAQDESAGWTATVDGEAQKIEAVDGALMGVFVPPGRHEVVLTYRPRTFVVGATMSVIAAIVAALLLLGTKLVRRRRVT